MKKMRKKFFVLAFMLGFISANAQVVKNIQLLEVQSMDGANHNGHEYVDFGLPSGVLWATCNVGAESPEEEGERFAWGEIEPKSIGSLNNYKFSLLSTKNRKSFFEIIEL